MWDFIWHILTSTFFDILLLSALAFLFRNLILERLKNAVKYDYEKKLKEYENELDTRTKTQLTLLTNRLTMELEIAKLKLGHYSERQFNIYNELWMSLCDLKYSMLQLWDQASEDKFKKFSKKLEETTKKLEISALVIEERHYAELMDFLNTFAEYEMGKSTLIDYRKHSISPDPDSIRQMINDNRATKERLLDYLPRMRSCLRNQINGRSIAEQNVR